MKHTTFRKLKKSKEKAFMVMEIPNVEVWETDDEVDQAEEIEAYKNYFCFMVDDDKERSPIHQQVVENINTSCFVIII